MLNKKFSQNLHDEFDEIGRTWTKQLFKRYGVTLQDNPDKYGVDLIAYRNQNKVGYVEVEVRTVWNGDKFNYDTLNIPCRKKKLLLMDLPTCLVSWSSNGDYGFICNSNVILESDIREAKNKYMLEAEYFYKVPINKIKLIKL